MSRLSEVKRGKIKEPDFLIIYGPDGVGKSTFGASAPNAIFLGPESGTSNLDVARYPEIKSYKEFIEGLRDFRNSNHDYRSLVIDSLDWIEPMVWAKTCEEGNVEQIENVGGGFSKGYINALKFWRESIDLMKDIRKARQMNIILIAHAESKTFQDPQTQSAYDRYQMKLHHKAAALFRENVESVLFATYEVFTKKDGQKTRAYGDGARVIFTERRPAFDAKNRCGLPFQLPLSWDEYMKAREAGNPEDPAIIKRNIEEMLSESKDADLKKLVQEALTKAKDDASRLEQIQNRLRVRLAG